MTRAVSLLAVFLVGFAVAGGAVLAVGTLGGDATAEPAPLETDRWSLADATPESAPTDGDVELEAAGPEATVVVHAPATGGGNALAGVPIDGIGGGTAQPGVSVGREASTLVAALAGAGHDVRAYDGSGGSLGGETLEDALIGADAVLTTAPAALSSEDRTALREFAADGGRTVITAEPGAAGSVSGVSSVADLSVQPGFLYNMAENDLSYLNVFVEPGSETELTAGVDRAVFRGPAPVAAADGTAALQTTAGTERSTDRAVGRFGVAAVNDTVAVLGDAGFMTPEYATRADNDVLIENVGAFLVAGAATGSEPSVNETAVLEATQSYYRALDAGDTEALAAAVHDDGEVTVPDELTEEFATNVTVELRDPTVVESSPEQAFVEGTERVDPVDAEATTQSVRIELRPQDGEWRVWELRYN